MCVISQQTKDSLYRNEDGASYQRHSTQDLSGKTQNLTSSQAMHNAMQKILHNYLEIPGTAAYNGVRGKCHPGGKLLGPSPPLLPRNPALLQSTLRSTVEKSGTPSSMCMLPRLQVRGTFRHGHER